jgi:hypothetical protein
MRLRIGLLETGEPGICIIHGGAPYVVRKIREGAGWDPASFFMIEGKGVDCQGIWEKVVQQAPGLR